LCCIIHDGRQKAKEGEKDEKGAELILFKKTTTLKRNPVLQNVIHPFMGAETHGLITL
jgi:hypothetical protein